jgi:predicted outer membrane repeat protein
MFPLDSAFESPRRRQRRFRAVRPAVDRLESRTLPATFVVNSFLDAPDENPGDGFARTADGQSTLRAAVMEANSQSGADTVILPAGAYRLTLLGPPIENSDATGDLDLVNPIEVQGAGSSQSIIDGHAAMRLFDLHTSGSVTISDVTLTGGSADVGGAIRTQGATNLSLIRSTVRDNRALQSGGALAALDGAGVINVSSCFFQSNSATELGGAIYAVNRDLAVAGSTFADNTASEGGATAALGSNYSISRSTFSGNRAGDAGNPGTAAFNSSVSSQISLSGANGGQGGGIFGVGPLVLYACTVSGNLGGNGSSAAQGALDRSAAKPRPKFLYYICYGGRGGAGGTGGIYSEDSLRMILCTLSGNVGGVGGTGGNSWGSFYEEIPPPGGTGGPGGPGAIYCSSNTDFVFVACTIAGNSGGTGGGGGGGAGNYYGHIGGGTGGAGTVGGVFTASATNSPSLVNTLVGSNSGGRGGGGGPDNASIPWEGNGPSGANGSPDLQGSFISLGHNLIGSTNGSSGFTNGVNGDLAGSGSAPLDPVLGPLTDNGGPTFTMALLHGSPALDAGDDAVLDDPYALTYDQRGFPRQSGSHVDIGAFEFQPGIPSALSLAQVPILSAALSANGRSLADTSRNFQLMFSNNALGATFTVLVTTNLSIPLNNWTVLGQPLQIAPGVFQFTDLETANNPQRFYRVSSP